MMAIFKTTLLMIVLPHGIWLLAYGTQLTVAQNDDQAYRNDARVNLENPTKATTTKAPTTISPLTSCPSNHELGSNRCICFTNTRTLLCSHFTGSFALTNHYLLDRLVIAYSDHTELSMLTQLITSRQLTFQSLLIQNNHHLQRINLQLFQIITNKLTIVWNSNLESIEHSDYTETAMFTQLISSGQISFESLEIHDNPKLQRIESQLIPLFTNELHITINSVIDNIPNLVLIDWSQLQPQLTSISINGINSLLHFGTTNHTYSKLTNLEFMSLNFGPTHTNLTIDKFQYPALKDLIIYSTNLEGTVRFVMEDKSPCGSYSIHLPSNNLDYFDFDALFPSNTITSNIAECHNFEVHLQYNQNMDKSLLINQLSVIARHAANLTVNLSEVALYCNCELYKLYQDFHLVRDVYCYNYTKLLQNMTLTEVC